MSILSRLVGALPRSRVAIAKRINALAAQVGDGADSEPAIQKLIHLAQSRNRFEKCFALETIGRLGPIAIKAAPIQIAAMSSPDPFVREAATSSMLRMLSKGEPPNWPLEGQLKKALSALIQEHVSEGAARHAVRTLRLLSPSTDLLPALECAALATNSSASKDALALYEKIKGQTLKALPPLDERLARIRDAFQSDSSGEKEEAVRIIRYTPVTEQFMSMVEHVLGTKRTSSVIMVKVIQAVAEKDSPEVVKCLERVAQDKRRKWTVRYNATLCLARYGRAKTKVISRIMPLFSLRQQAEIKRELAQKDV